MSHWNAETAEWYAENYGEYATNKLGVESLELGADFTVIDIGCGTGCALRHVSKPVTDGVLIGFDPVTRMVEIAREKTAAHSAGDRIQYYEGGAEKLSIDDSIADVVLAFDSYDHWQDKAKGLKEVRRVLKSGGQFVVVKDGGLEGGDEANEAFLQFLQKAGFKVVKENYLNEDDIGLTQWICEVQS